jgi:CBS-domain-containing membrane protein
MKNRRIRHMPVLDEEQRLCGVVSIGDLNAYEAHDREVTIYILQEYISGRA